MMVTLKYNNPCFSTRLCSCQQISPIRKTPDILTFYCSLLGLRPYTVTAATTVPDASSREKKQDHIAAIAGWRIIPCLYLRCRFVHRSLSDQLNLMDRSDQLDRWVDPGRWGRWGRLDWRRNRLRRNTACLRWSALAITVSSQRASPRSGKRLPPSHPNPYPMYLRRESNRPERSRIRRFRGGL